MDDVDQGFELGDLLVERSVDTDAQRRDTTSLVVDQPGANDVRRADKIGAETDVDGDSCRSAVAIPCRPEPLHLGDVVAVALTREGVVVEVLVRRTHRSERERIAIGMATSGRLDRRGVVAGELESDSNHTVDVVERTTGGMGAIADRVEERVGGGREEGVPDPTIGEFTGESQVGRAEGRDVDGDLGGLGT